ncbi:MAG TPA: hypothetical protein VN519_13705 [Bryobacteraceae bacterium]|nr:hypothetical protein [Bryobacteraceae bacterium]
MNRTFVVTAFAAILSMAPLASAGTIGNRKDHQQDRIAQGVKSGSLTPHETARLERRESALNKEVHAERTLNNGSLTHAEKRQVNRQQDRLSRQIYRNKHDAN